MANSVRVAPIPIRQLLVPGCGRPGAKAERGMHHHDRSNYPVWVRNTTTAYFIGEDEMVTDLGQYQWVYEARKSCEVRSGRELHWYKRFDGIWEAESDTSLYRLVTSYK